MTEDTRRRQRKRKGLWAALLVLVFLLAVLLVPPLVSVSRYKSRITQLMSASLGRPVRLSAVEVRLLPRPGFVLDDLTVEEDPAYGAEPILHANTVTASIRLLPLWRGRLEISTISVDEASLNLVRTTQGRWNLDPLFRTVAAKTQQGPGGPEAGSAAAQATRKLPTLEATNSRINIKNGAEKLPFSLVNTELSFWQDSPGEWRIRLRGQPARTDLSLDLADTGILRLEGRAHQAAELRQMPLHLDIEWREAQLGQLTRLMIGSDPGWRGDLTGEVHLDGSPEAAQVKTRLRATGVHRAEFAPAATLDFDANCGFVAHFSARAIDNLLCDSPLGSGRIRLAGGLPGEGAKPHFSVELDKIPVQAGLDALRTVRSGFGPGLEAKGTVSGKVSYDATVTEQAAQDKQTKPGRNHPAALGPLIGSFTVEGFQLSGDGLTTPIQAPRLVLEPAPASPGHPEALVANLTIPAGAPAPLMVTARIALSGYQLTVKGQAALARARELAHAAAMRAAETLDGLAGEPLTVDLTAEGPWLPGQRLTAAAPGSATDDTIAHRLTGTIQLHNANWKAGYLNNHVEISTATLRLDNGQARWDPVAFNYGPVKGTASLEFASPCGGPQPCIPRFQVQFGALDASALQAAILGAREKGTLLSTLLARLRPSTPSPASFWPQLEGTVKADSLLLGPVTLREVTATLRTLPDGAEITGLDAALLGGRVHGSGTLKTGDMPTYTLTGHFEKLSPAAVGQLMALRFTGASFDADGQIDLAGFTDTDLANSVKGTLHFDWRHGSVAGASASLPTALSRFDHWTSDAEIADHAIVLKANEVQQGGRKSAAEATVTLGTPAKVAFTGGKEPVAKK